MRGDLYNGSEGTDRLADILKDDVDDFLASSDESDFVFYESSDTSFITTCASNFT